MHQHIATPVMLVGASTTQEKVFIGISGLIGAGKTTLTNELAGLFGLPPYYEGVSDNPYLPEFYKDMKTYSFPLQVYLLNRRFRQHQAIIWNGYGGVSDRTIYEDGIFAKLLMEDGLMSKLDYDTYTSLFANMSHFLSKPTLIVHLEVSPEEALARIRARGRACEAGISIEYLRSLKRGYDHFLGEVSRSIPVIKVNWEQKNCDVRQVALDIRAKWQEMHTISTVQGTRG